MGASQSGEKANVTRSSVEKLIASAPIVVFSSSTCGYCAQAIETLMGDGFQAPTLKVVNASSSQRKVLREMTGAGTVPSIWIRGVFIGGCNDGPLSWHGLMKIRRNGTFQKLMVGEGNREG